MSLVFQAMQSLPRDASHTFKRAQRGLFHGKRRVTGNNVSFSQRKTRRHWLPNVQTKRLYSETLDEMLKIKVTTKALRCIKKAGGLDAYILRTKPEDLQSQFALELREKITAAKRRQATLVE